MVYLLAAGPGGRGGTYVGMTYDLDRRLAQHNGQQSGGAKATKGKAWKRICHVKGFPDQRAALQFEWAWKARTRAVLKGGGGGIPLQRRFRALQALLAEERPTSLAEPYSSYPSPPEVVMECPEEEFLAL
jgi:predicted GIY-YIG superfamily endonuclease